jgi:hypothetical protein
MTAKAKRQPTTFHSYTEAQWTVIERELPSRSSARDIRFELEQIGREFWGMRQQRLRRPSSRDYERLRYCVKMLARLESPALKKDLEFAHWRLTGWDKLLEAWSGAGFQRKRDVHRELLYERVIRLWTGPLGGSLGVSTTGPLARFLDAVLEPILGPEEMPGLDGIKAILRREKNRLRRHHEFWVRR